MSEPYEAALASLLRSAPDSSPEESPAPRHADGVEPVLTELIYSFMLWETTPKQADAAFSKLLGSFIDLNELRISLPDELAELLGNRFARGAERTLRLRMALNQIFLLEHEMSLARLIELPKRDARQYLVDLPGMPSFVASRVSLLALGVHAFPLDDRLRQFLVGAAAIDPAHDADQASAWLERQFRAGEAADAYLRLERVAEITRTKPPTKAGRKARPRSAAKRPPATTQNAPDKGETRGDANAASKPRKKASTKRKSTIKSAGKSPKGKPRS